MVGHDSIRISALITCCCDVSYGNKIFTAFGQFSRTLKLEPEPVASTPFLLYATHDVWDGTQ
jgi:hypothetical protein